MQKKILACLLVAPVAGNAMANFNINQDTYPADKAESVSGVDQGFKFNFNSGEGLIAPIGAGIVKFQTVKLNRGAYHLNVTGAKNLQVTVLGKTYKVDNEIDIPLNVTGETDVTVEMSAIDPTQGFSCLSTWIMVELADDYAAQLQDLLDKAVPNGLEGITKLHEGVDASLKETYKKLTEDYTKISGDITKIENEITLDLYNAFQLWEVPAQCTVGKAIAALKTPVEEFNTEAETANKNAEAAAANQAAIEALNSLTEGWQAGLDAVIAEATKADEAIENKDDKGIISAQLKAAEDAFQKNIDAINAAIKEQGPKLTAATDFKYPGELSEKSMDDALTSLQNALAAAKASYAKWLEYVPQIEPLTKTYNQYYTLINSEADVWDGPDAFGTERTDLLSELTALYNANNNSNGAIKPQTPAAEITAAIAAIQKAKEDMKSMYETFAAKVKVQNDAYTAAMKAYDEFQKGITEASTLAEGVTIPDSQKANFEALVKAANDALATFKKGFDAAYQENNMPGSEYNKNAQAVQDAIDAINAAKSEFGAFVDLQKQLVDADKKVKEISDELTKKLEEDKSEFKMDLYGKFKGQIDGLQKAIEAIIPGSATQAAEVAAVKTAITSMETTAQKLKDGYLAAIDGYDAFDKALAEYKKFVPTKLIIKGADESNIYDGLEDKGDKKGLNTLLAEYKNQLTSISTLEAQLSYNATVALNEELGTAISKITAAKEEFAKSATEANEAYAVKVVGDAQAAFDANKTVGDIASNAKIVALQDALTAAQGKVAAALTNGVNVAGLGDADKDLQDVVNTGVALAGGIKDYVDIYNTLTNMDPDIRTLIKEAYDYNNGKDKEGNDNTIDPAKSHFNKQLDPDNGEFITLYKTLLSNLNTGLAAGTLHDKGAEFKTQADALVKEVNDVLEQIKTNQAAYNELLGVSQNTLNTINRVYDNIDKNCQEAGAREKYLEKLNSLKNVDLAGVDVAVAGDFGNGGLNEANKTAYITKYNAISAAANKITTEFAGEVGDLNDATSGNLSWRNEGIAGLRDLKDEAVRVYNTYFYDVKNKGYREFINADLISHSGLYDFTQEITTLDATIEKYIEDNTLKGYAFSVEEFRENALDKIDALAKEIDAKKDALITNMNALGATYWTDQNDYHGGVYQYLENSMAAAGMFKTDKEGAVVETEDGTPVLNNTLAGTAVGNALEEALKSYNAATARHETVEVPEEGKPNPAGYKKQIGFVMDELATLLDKVVYDDKTLEAAADIQWAAVYKAFTDDAENALESVDSYTLAKAEAREAAKEAIQEQIDLAAEYDKQISDEEANTFASLPDGINALKDLEGKIKDALDQLNKQNEFGEESKKVYDEYTGADGIIPGLNSDLDKLIAYSASLAADSRSESVAAIANAKAAVDKLTKFVEENKADLAAEQPSTHAEELTEEAEKAIADAYPEVRKAEIAVLNSIMAKVREAFNNAKAADKLSTDKATEWENKINAAITDIADLNNLTAEDPKDEFQSAAQALEGTLCDYLAELEADYTHPGANTSAIDASARLTALYEDVLAALEAAKDALAASEPSVQTEFAGAYDESESELEKIHGEYSNAANMVVALEGNYTADLNAVAQAIAAKKAEIEAANQKALAQKAIDDNAAAIQKNLADLTQQLEEIRSFLSTYQLEEQFDYDIQNIENMISQKETILGEMIEEKTFTATTEIPTQDIEMALASLDYSGHVAAVDYVHNLANSAVKEARENLKRAHLLEETRTELSDKLTAANQLRLDAYQTMQDAINAYETSKSPEEAEENLKAFYETYEQVIADLTKAENDARAVSEGVYNNEFTPGDVTLDPDGAVTVVDVQQVITWVGEGVTYDELKDGAEPRQAYAADVNDDQKINIADAVAILNISLKDLNNPAATPVMFARGLKAAADNNIGLALNGTEDGIREYAVMINNTTEFVAGQLDLKIGSGMEIVDIELTGRAVDHELFRFDNSTGARVIIASMTNAALEGNDGAMLIVRTRGAGNLEVEGAIFADSNAAGYTLGSNGLSSIDGINESYQNVKERIYNVAGQTMDRIQRGINIIRKSNGKTTKEMHK